ncbi:MAG TPA: hypothetical protein VFQ54_02565 [Thermomicrobiales bacterium]|nr:hypothetical protein [Thermomicrobiales bacterium]
MKAPAARHYINRITAKTAVKEVTTLIDPGIPVEDDMRGIRGGRAIRDGDRFTINGRTYQQEPNGTMFPVDGDGLIPRVPRGVMNALLAFARYNEINERSEFEIASREISDEDVEMAREIWRRRERYRDGQGTDN